MPGNSTIRHFGMLRCLVIRLWYQWAPRETVRYPCVQAWSAPLYGMHTDNRKTDLKLADQDEQVDLVLQARHAGHDEQELLRQRQLVWASGKALQRLNLVLFGRNLHKQASTS